MARCFDCHSSGKLLIFRKTTKSRAGTLREFHANARMRGHYVAALADRTAHIRASSSCVLNCKALNIGARRPHMASAARLPSCPSVRVSDPDAPATCAMARSRVLAKVATPSSASRHSIAITKSHHALCSLLFRKSVPCVNSV